MQKIDLFWIVLLILVAFASGFAYFNFNNHFDNGDIIFDYPKAWNMLNDSDGNVFVYDHATNKSGGDPTTNKSGGFTTIVTLEPSFMYTDYYDFVNVKSMNPTNKIISTKNVTINQNKGYELIYTEDRPDIFLKHRVIWYIRPPNINDVDYYIDCMALPNDFDKNRENFNLIINSFQYLKKSS